MSSPVATFASPAFENPLQDLADIAVTASYPEIGEELRQIEATLARGALTIAVLGQFKRGKSSLLNAFAGKKVFPTGLLPLTAVATRLVRGREEARVTESNGGMQTVPLLEIEDFVSERKNPGNRRGIVRVEISMPLPEWTAGITFVDCPGIGSPHDANTSAARAILPQADAAIFVLSPDPSITSDEIAFLSEVSSYATKFFFVLNKADLVDPGDLIDLETYLKHILENRCGLGPVRLYPVSAKHAIDGAERGDHEALARSGVRELWDDIHRFVGPERAQSVRQVAQRRTLHYAEKIRGMIDLSVSASRLTREQFDRGLAILEQGIADVRVEHRATLAMYREEVDALSRRLQARPRELVTPQCAPLVERMNRHLAASRGGTAGAAVRKFEQELQKEVGPVVGQIRDSLAAEAEAELGRIARGFAARLTRWLAELGALVEREFDVILPSLAVEGGLASADRYTDRIESLYEGTMVGQTALLLPGGLLRRRLRAQLSRIVADEMDAQAGRISSDLVDRIERSLETLRTRATEQLESQILTLESALKEGQHRQATGREATSSWVAKMGALRRRVEEIERRVDAGHGTP